jgi:nucleoside-diphosphate-sugar epimerase
MAMPDAVRALVEIAKAPQERLTRQVYNVTGFSLSAEQIRARVIAAFPNAEISYAPDRKREAIVDSWPANTDDSAARLDWDWSPAYDVERAFEEYLFPNVRRRYEAALAGSGALSA